MCSIQANGNPIREGAGMFAPKEDRPRTRVSDGSFGTFTVPRSAASRSLSQTSPCDDHGPKREASSHNSDQPGARRAAWDFGKIPLFASDRTRSASAQPKLALERKDGVVHGPAGSANRFDDCPAAWKPTANAAQKTGASWLDNVVNGLTSLPKPIPAPVANLLTYHFHTTFDKDIAKIAARYKQLNKAINQSIDFECETSCDPNVLAYVYSVWSDLHLCPYWFNSASELQASTVIHELAHDVIGCDDNAYEWQTAKYAAMSVKDAMDNADSYAHFAWDASH